MSRSGKNPGERLRSAKSRTASSARWLTRQLNDPYVKQAKADGYRSRAAYKLIELDERFGVLKGVKRVVDLGIAPGGWSQVVRQRCPEARVVGIDLLPTDPIDGVTILQMDFMDDAAPGAAHRGARRRARPGAVGHGRQHRRSQADRSPAHDGPGRDGGRFRDRRRLRRAAAFVAKVLAGGTDATLLALLKRHFTTVKHAKPPASRKDSSEWYVIAQGFKRDPG